MTNTDHPSASMATDFVPPPKASSRSSPGLVDRLWTPKWLIWDPEASHELSWGMNILFGVTAAFSVANLYYSHPILNVLADDFGVSDERAALVPTIAQAGYAGGLLFIIPMGDIVRRRPFILALIFATAMLWLGSTLTTSFPVFLALSFLVGLLTVTPQLMFPLTMQYAPGQHRATMTSIVMSGVVFGILVARLLSGIMTEYVSTWRYVYWASFALQMTLFLLLAVFMPDYPVVQRQSLSSSSSSGQQQAPVRFKTAYPSALRKIVTLPFAHPTLVQQCCVAFLVMGMFTCFWTTLTFQLADVFHLSTLAIGLFALVGLAPVLLNPLISRVLISRVHPSASLLVALTVTLLAVCIGVFVGTFSLAGPVIWAFLGDLGMNTSVVASRLAFSRVDPSAGNAVNAVYMIATFCGQLLGTAVGNALYANGGWMYSGALCVAQVGTAVVVVLARGPHEKGWVGWRGGWDVRLPSVASKKDEESERHGGQNDHVEAGPMATRDEGEVRAGNGDEEKRVENTSDESPRNKA